MHKTVPHKRAEYCSSALNRSIRERPFLYNSASQEKQFSYIGFFYNCAFLYQIAYNDYVRRSDVCSVL